MKRLLARIKRAPSSSGSGGDDAGFFSSLYQDPPDAPQTVSSWRDRAPRIGAKPFDRKQGAEMFARLWGADRHVVALNPDAYIARTVIARYHHDGHLDAAYLSVLSADAVPEIERLPEPYRSCVLAGLTGRPSTVDGWYAVNAGRRAALKARPPEPGAVPCPQVFRGPTDGA